MSDGSTGERRRLPEVLATPSNAPRPGVTKEGIIDPRPEREALTGVWTGRARLPFPSEAEGAVSGYASGNGHGASSNGHGGGPGGVAGPAGGAGPAATPTRRRRRSGRDGRGGQEVVPDVAFESYYGKAVINKPVWASPDIPGYLFLGGLAGASSVLAAGAQLTGRLGLARATKVAAAAAGGLSIVALVHDLGRPGRFLNMLRVFKPTSPMSVGSWLLAGYVPAAGVAALSDVTGLVPPIGALATAGAAVLGPTVASYTGALVANTAVPAWHDGYREMPFLFVASAASAGGGVGLLGASLEESGPARRLAIAGGLTEVALSKVMERRMPEEVAESYHEGKAKRFMRLAEVLTGVGVVGAAASSGLGPARVVAPAVRRVVSALAGAAIVTASACTRFGVFWAGEGSAIKPEATTVPQRRRLLERGGKPAA